MEQNKIDPKDCLDVILTDIQMHAQKFRKPLSLGRQFVKAAHGSKVNRVFSNDSKMDPRTGAVSLSIDLEEGRLFELARQKGKKYVRYLIPKEGLSIFPGPDIIEKLQSVKKKLLQRVLTREYNKGVK